MHVRVVCRFVMVTCAARSFGFFFVYFSYEQVNITMSIMEMKDLKENMATSTPVASSPPSGGAKAMKLLGECMCTHTYILVMSG